MSHSKYDVFVLYMLIYQILNKKQLMYVEPGNLSGVFKIGYYDSLLYYPSSSLLYNRNSQIKLISWFI